MATEGSKSGIARRVLRSASFCAAAACLVLTSTIPGSAAYGDIVFFGTITNSNQCVIIVNNDGRFGVSTDKTVLSSKLPGGFAAVAEVRSNHAYSVTAVAIPTLTVYPNDGEDNVTLVSRFSGQSILNGRTFAEQAGTTPVVLRNGLSRTRLTVHLAATRTVSPFPSGYYQGTVIVRCE